MNYKPILILLILLISVFQLHADPPNWSVNAPSYGNQATVTAQISINDIPNHSMANMIAFMVNDEVRAVGEASEFGSEAMYYITVYSNIASGEAMDIKVYVAADDKIYTAVNDYTFTKNKVTGDPDNPYLIEVNTTSDFGISFTTIAEQAALQSNPIVIDLADYLMSQDGDPVNYTYTANNLLQVTQNGSVLEITGANGTWTGSTSLQISAQETTGVPYSAEAEIFITIDEDFTAPVWENGAQAIQNQAINPGEQFELVNLNDHEFSYDGGCLEFLVEPIIPKGSPRAARPEWSVNAPSFQYSMTLTSRVKYTDFHYFDHQKDVLGAFVRGQCRGVAYPTVQAGEVYYYLTVNGNVDNEEVKLRFYSETSCEIYPLAKTYPFRAFTEVGTPNIPELLEVSPLSVNLSPFGGLLIEANDPNWEGAISFNLTAQDCKYTDMADVMEVSFQIGELALPINLLHFSGRSLAEKGVLLDWQLGDITALSTMEVERSTTANLQDWKALKVVADAKNKSNDYLDAAPAAGLNYYRLLLIDEAGKRTYSPIVTVYYNQTTNWTVTPNPVTTDEVWLQNLGDVNSNTNVQIHDASGQLKYERTLDNNNSNQQRLLLPNLSNGVYFITIINEEQRAIQKLLVSH